MNSIRFLLLIVVAVSLCACGRKTDQARSLVDRGATLAEAEQYEDAIRLFNKAIDIDPACADAFLQLALVYDEGLGDTQKAVVAYERYIGVAKDGPAKDVAQRWLADARGRKDSPAVRKAVVATHEAVPADAKQELDRKERQFELLREQTTSRYEEQLAAVKQELEEARRKMASLENENKTIRGTAGNDQRVAFADQIRSNEALIARLAASLDAQTKEAAVAVRAGEALQTMVTTLQAQLENAPQIAAVTPAAVVPVAEPAPTAAVAVVALKPSITSAVAVAALKPSTTAIRTEGLSGPRLARNTVPSVHATNVTAAVALARTAASTYRSVPARPVIPARTEETGKPPSGATRGYTVKPGDSLMKIARDVYGDASKWTVIYNENRDTLERPNQLQVGQSIRIPATSSPTLSSL